MVCGLYKVTYWCKMCKVSKNGVACHAAICPPGARNHGVDLDLRDCWARHKLYGLPGKGDDKADWRGPWWSGYEEHRKNKASKGPRPLKRPRASTGSSMPPGIGL